MSAKLAQKTYPKSRSKITDIIVWIAQKYLNKYRQSYFQKYAQKWPIILVTGNSGKSSTTLLFADYYRYLGYQVFTGATQNHCYNSITGLSMVLGGFESDFEGSGAFFSKIWFLLRSLWGLILPVKTLNKKSILIYEAGFDHQYEANYFVQVFNSGVNLLILTNLGWEHSAGFEDTFDSQSLDSLKNKIPDHWNKILNSSEYPDKLKNIALEQIRLAEVSEEIIYPEGLNFYSNTIVDSKNRFARLEARRNPDLSLAADGYNYGMGYLLPKSMAKNILLLQKSQEIITYEIIKNKPTARKEKGLQKDVGVSETITGEINSDNNNFQNLQRFLSQSHFPNSRFSILNGKNSSTIVDSSYNSDPDSLHGFLDLLEEQIVDNHFDYKKTNPKPKHILIFGEMRELGDTAKDQHTKILERIAGLHQKYPESISETLLLGKEWLNLDSEGPVQNQQGAKFGEVKHREIKICNQTFKTFTRGGDIYSYIDQNDMATWQTWFWIKGSRNTIFLEGLVEKLLQNPEDKKRLCCQDASWEEKRKPFYS